MPLSLNDKIIMFVNGFGPVGPQSITNWCREQHDENLTQQQVQSEVDRMIDEGQLAKYDTFEEDGAVWTG